MSTKEISAAAQALGRRGGLKSLGAKSKAELSAFGKAAAQKRWAAFEAGRQAGEKVAENFINAGATVGGMFSASAQQLEALAGAVVKVEPTKPKRALPKAGTVNSLVLAAMSIKPMTVDAIYERAADVYGYERLRNALSSLRSAGHVVSEPKPGSRREKLWRLA